MQCLDCVVWAAEEPALQVLGALEYFTLIATSHKLGIIGGVGSPEHQHALDAWVRFLTTGSSEAAAIKAAHTAIKHFRATFPNSKVGVIEQALSTEEREKQSAVLVAQYASTIGATNA